MAALPFKVEISRTMSYVEWADLVIYADTLEAAQKRATVLAAQANATSFFDPAPFSWLTDDGTATEWEAQPAEPCPDSEIADFSPDQVLDEPDDVGDEDEGLDLEEMDQLIEDRDRG